MTTALYRRYRPDTFADVIGQSHVTEPLVHALRADRISHAYLFSGPRGCGKTTSARILARCLNCAQGPTAEPCGACESCVELATGGPGSLDVVEIDAASHGGVDDARELRERATFAPARDRFKIYILDEAHMVTSQGFNALLKIVEEPPPHVKFIFATTEPDKVIGTIRSRTHHYPFRLVAPDDLVPYLTHLVEVEGVRVGAGVLPLVVRAGGGSVRDSLSVLDQLLAGAGPEGIDYEGAVALLGYTHSALLDDAVEAVAARDGAAAFRVVDRVVATGHEPRRFVEDLLERLRDLIVLDASGEAARAVFRDLPVDQFERMVAQAQVLGSAELSRSADLANQALTEMVGATSPRLHLELLAARLLLPAVSDDAQGLGARIDRVERVLAQGGSVAAAPAPAGPTTGAAPVAGREPAAARPTTARTAGPAEPGEGRAAPTRDAETSPPTPEPTTHPEPTAHPEPTTHSEPTREPSTTRPEPTPEGAEPTPTSAEPTPASGTVASPGPSAPDRAGEGRVAASGDDAVSGDREGRRPAARPGGTPSATTPGDEPDETRTAPATEEPASPPAPAPAAAPPVAPAPVAAMEAEVLRRRWPEVLETLRGLRMATWVLVSQNAQVLSLDESVVRLGFSTPQLATTFRGGSHADQVARALRETLGLEVRVEAVADGAQRGGGREPAPRRADQEDAEPGRPAAVDPEWTVAAPASPSAVAPTTGAGTGRTEEGDAGQDEAPPWDEPEATAGSGPEGRGAPGEPDASEGRTTPAGPSAPQDRTVAAGRAASRARVAPTAASAPESPAASAPAPAEPGTGAPAPGLRVDPRTRPVYGRPAEPGLDTDEFSPDDEDAATSGLVGAPLVAQMLGGTVIDEIPDGTEGP